MNKEMPVAMLPIPRLVRFTLQSHPRVYAHVSDIYSPALRLLMEKLHIYHGYHVIA